MPFRLLAAAFMAALGATLGLMLVRGIVAPAVMVHVRDNDLLLLHQLGLGSAGSLVLQILFLGQAVRLRTGLLWGAAGFIVFILAPWLAVPDILPGQVPANAGNLGLWLLAVAAAAGGLWFVGQPGAGNGFGRLAGLVLLALPVLAGLMGGDGDGLTTPGYGELADHDPDVGVWSGLGLNLLFWLLLGVFSVLSARRVLRRKGGKTGLPAERPGDRSEG